MTLLRPFLLRTNILNRINLNSSIRRFSAEQPIPPDPEPPKRKARWYSISGQVERLLLRSRITDDPDTARLAAKSTSTALFTLIGMSALGTLGVDTAPILTGIGVTGFTLGFALKETATNFLSGMLLVLSRPFRKGQHLRVMVSSMPGLEGEVISIDARYVLLRAKSGATIMVPSVVVYTNPFQVSNTTPTSNEGGEGGETANGNK